MRSGRRIAAALVVLVAIAGSVVAQDSGAADQAARSPAGPSAAPPATLAPEVEEVLPDARQDFRVGVAAFSSGETGVESRIAGFTFPRLLLEHLDRIDRHELSDEEIVAYASRQLASAAASAAAELRGAVDARDRLLFSTTDDEEQRVQARAAADERVSDARALLEAIRGTGAASIPTESSRPLDFWDGHAEGRLLAEVDEESVADLAEEEDLDLVLWGEVEEIEGYLAIDVIAFHRFLETNTPAGGTIARPEEVGLDARPVARETAGILLGRPYASLEVVASVDDAAVFVDGQLLGYGRVSAPFLEPGEHGVRVVADGYVPVERAVTLETGERVVETVDLETGVERVVRIQSSPAGADVYADSVWVGRTPLEHRFPPEPTIVRLRREGHLESRFVVDTASPPVINRALLSDSIDWSEELVSERDDFYQALTWFVVSVPVTLLLRGGYQSVRGAFPPLGSELLDDEELLRLARRGNILYWSSIGGFLVNGGLFVNLLISIFDYVEVGEGPHNQ
ncbi:MAG: PEGA domain-containing protein [bacterium]